MPRPSVGTTGYRIIRSRASQWTTWWEFNKWPFLLRREVQEEPPISGSDDFYLGGGRKRVQIDMLEPNDKDLTEKIVPALAALLEKERNRDIVTACLVGLGRIGKNASGVDLEEALRKHIDRDDQEIRETAVLSLGIAGRKEALPSLAALLRDDKVGRKLVDRSEVKERTRAFAAYGLGLLAARSKNAKFKQEIYDELWPLLADRKQRDRDLGVALVSAIGIFELEPSGAQKRLLWQAVEDLFRYFEEDRGRGYEAVQAHAPIAIARLVGRGSTDLHQRVKSRFAAVITAKKRRSNPILRSCAIALGMVTVAPEKHIDDARFCRVLQQSWEKGSDQNQRFFSLVSLGRIGGASNREFLVRAYVSGSKGTERPWGAIALGLQAFQRGTEGKPDEVVARMLLEDLEDVSDNSLRGALAIGLGMTGYAKAAPAVERLLVDNESEQQSAGYLALCLALLGDRGVNPKLAQVMARSARRPFLVRQLAIALGQLGDRNASMQIIDMMQQSDSAAVLSALAMGVGRIGDRRSIDPLLEMLADRGLTKIARSFVAAALGLIGDQEALPFNNRLTVDSNYTSAVDTLTNGITGVLDIL
ncbi:MAG: HEAT repeat domain-containing protein [bacterium]|nr:HEAT repeat domain-containing protein [bacterium]